MKLQQHTNVEEVIGVQQQHKFKITDGSQAIIMDSLINLYSDPIGSIVREITSNCIDANRERNLKLEGKIPMEAEDNKSFWSTKQTVCIEYVTKNTILGVDECMIFHDNGYGLSQTRVQDVFTTEINSVTDNPIIFIKEDKIISGGNFHGQPLAMAMDYLAIGLAELGSISERRTYQLISGKRGLPAFLVANPGLNSGMMIPQYTAASIVSQNKQLCMPASIDSIVSSNGQEDHVSMGANAATKLYRIVENTERILAIELLNATQGIAFRNIKSSDFIESILDIYRDEVSFLDNDRILHDDIENSVAFLRNLSIDNNLL